MDIVCQEMCRMHPNNSKIVPAVVISSGNKTLPFILDLFSDSFRELKRPSGLNRPKKKSTYKSKMQKALSSFVKLVRNTLQWQDITSIWIHHAEVKTM